MYITFMKKTHYRFAGLFILLAALSIANPIDDKASSFVYNGAPVSKIVKDNQYIIKKNYAIHYRFDTKTAEYVVEHITKEKVNGTFKRQDDFRPDPDILPAHQSVLSDYAGNPYDRGHLVPAGDNTHTAEAMSESFYLSNMVPQVPNNNRGIWKQLETAVRIWVNEGKDIYVVSGTTYNKDHKSIGVGKVGVPDFVWKVVIDATSNKAIAFYFPNEALPVSDLPKYIVSIDEVEQKTGINFNPKMSEKLQEALESAKANPSEWSGIIKK
jgi:endonuclease G